MPNKYPTSIPGPSTKAVLMTILLILLRQAANQGASIAENAGGDGSNLRGTRRGATGSSFHRPTSNDPPAVVPPSFPDAFRLLERVEPTAIVNPPPVVISPDLSEASQHPMVLSILVHIGNSASTYLLHRGIFFQFLPTSYLTVTEGYLPFL